jgi:uncharacterized oxidoreductase
MVDLLAGVLTGAGGCTESRVYPGDGLFVMAIDVARFRPLEGFAQEVADVARYVTDCPRAPGVEHIYTPGEIERERREVRLREGVFVEQGTWTLIEQLCRRLEVAPPEPSSS